MATSLKRTTLCLYLYTLHSLHMYMNVYHTINPIHHNYILDINTSVHTRPIYTAPPNTLPQQGYSLTLCSPSGAPCKEEESVLFWWWLWCTLGKLLAGEATRTSGVASGGCSSSIVYASLAAPCDIDPVDRDTNITNLEQWLKYI